MKNLFEGRILLVIPCLLIGLTIGGPSVYGQMKVGDNPATLNAGSVLEIESANKGLLFPRVELMSTTQWTLTGTPVAGMQVYNKNNAITAGMPSYPVAAGGVGIYCWDGTGWVPAKTPGAVGGGDFDWLKSSNSSNPSDPTDIASNIYHGGTGNQDVMVRANEIDKFAKFTVRSGHESAEPTVGNLFAGRNANNEGVVAIRAESQDPIVFETTFFPELGPREVMRIGVLGNVGIGTSTPTNANALQVRGYIFQGNNAVDSESSTSTFIGEGFLDILQENGPTNGAISFRDKRDDAYDARIHYSNSIGSKGAMVFEVETGGGKAGSITSKMTILNENGNVGIGKISPAYKLDVTGEINASGKVRSAGISLTSDERLKENILQIQDGLGIVTKLNPVSYNKKATIADSIYDKSEMGFIAQEVRKILPQLVSEGNDADKTLALDYNSLIPVLTRAIQEQQRQIEMLSAELDAQSVRLDKRSVRLDAQSDELAEIKRILVNSKNFNAVKISK